MIKILLQKVKNQTFSLNMLFILVFFICFFVYGYNKILFSPPVGVHQWRNSISAAFAKNYYYNSFDYKTRTNALLADNRSSDVTIVEFPIVYYFVSILYRIFGPHEFLYRIVNILIGFLGLFCLFKAALLLFKDKWYALAVSVFVFTSPIFVFYTNNFIPDATCLSIEFIGMYFFFKYYYHRNVKHWYLSLFFMLIGGLIKTPSLIFFFSISAIGLYNIFIEKKKYFPSFKIFFLSVTGVLLVLFAWYAYSKIYSDIHGGSVSPVGIRPLWILPKDIINITLDRMSERFNKGDYHSSKFLLLTLLLLIINAFFYKKYPRLLNQLVILTVFGAISFTLLFFRSMRQHDYYQLGNLVIIPIIYLSFFTMLYNQYPKIYQSLITKGFLVVIMVLLINDCRINMNKRFCNSDWSYYSSMKKIYQFGELEPYLRRLGIERNDIVYATPDISINISLYLMNQKGFTDYGSQHLSPIDRLNYLKERGLEYVIVGDRKEVANFDQLENHFGNKIGQFGTTEIYKVVKTIEGN